MIVNLRRISYKKARTEIIEYLKNAGNKTVYISELAENLRLDIGLIQKILSEVKKEKSWLNSTKKEIALLLFVIDQEF